MASAPAEAPVSAPTPAPAPAPKPAPAKAAAKQKKQPGVIRSIVDVVVIVAVAAILATSIKTFVVQPYEIPSESMLQTIQVGDRVLSEKITSHASNPERGDIITFIDPRDGETTLIKRVIAVAGDVVTLKDGVVYINGEAEEGASYTRGTESWPLDASIVYPYEVPEGYVWVMGDNRTNSLDSRSFGAISCDSITGHAFWTYWPLDSFGALE